MTPPSRGGLSRDAEKELLTQQRKNRLLLWLLVGLPSVVLGGLALLSIVLFQESEVAVAGKKLERSAGALAGEAAEALRETEEALGKISLDIVQRAVAGEEIGTVAFAARILLLDRGGELIFPRRTPGDPGDGGEEREARNALVALEDGKGRLLAEGNPYEAIDILSRALDLTRGPARPEILLHLAVANERVGNLDEALLVYLQLLSDHPGRRAPDGVPWAVRARLGAARIQLLLRDVEGARDHVTTVLRDLTGDLRMEAAARGHLLDVASGQVREILSRLLPDRQEAESRSLQELLRHAVEEDRFLGLLDARLLPDLRDLLQSLEQRPPNKAPSWTYLTMKEGSDRIVVGALPVRDDSGWLTGLLVYELDLDLLQTTRLDPRAREIARAQDASVRWTDPPPKGETSDGTVATAVLPAPLGFRAVEVTPLDPTALGRKRLLEAAALGLLVLSMIAAIVVGTVVTGRATRKELELARLKSDFVAGVTHELKSPLTSILLLAEKLEARDTEPRTQRAGELIVREARRLSRLIEQILDLTRLESGGRTLALEVGDPIVPVREAVDFLRPRAEEEGFHLELFVDGDLPDCRFDRDALSQVTLSLLENAFVHSEGDRAVVVRMLRAGTRAVAVEFLDSGVGIPENLRPRLFERFVRGDAAGKSSPGAGLGLSIARALARAQGGDLAYLESARGARFVLTLVVAR